MPLQRVKKRPVSPHVFETDGNKFHYKMPINAVTSIMNRATGVALTVGESCCPNFEVIRNLLVHMLGSKFPVASHYAEATVCLCRLPLQNND